MAAGDPGVLKRNFSATAIETTLVNSISSASTGDTTTSVSVVSTSGYPAVPFTIILAPDTNKEEVVTCISVVGTTLQIIRGQDGTQAVSHTAGTSVRHGISGRDFREEQTHIAARGYDADTAILANAGQTHVHGLESGDGSIVGSDQLVTLTRKTLTTPVINGATLTGTVTSTASIVVSGAGTITGLSSAGMVASSAAPKNYVDSILGSATAASTSAASAATSATSAATSATSAATSATSSASSASAAATSASSALTSQTAAATSATSAAASATAAATSATSAATSATSSASSASAAATSASSAATSAGSSETSAIASATSASAAATSASSAATSAASASTSASSALTSANSASADAITAAASVATISGFATTASNSASAAATSAASASTSASSASTDAASAATSASSALTSATSAATSYDSFDDRYLGAKASPPTLDNDGNALITGALYWNSVSNQMFAWDGSGWGSISSTAAIFRYKYTAAGGETSESGLDDNGITLSYIAGKEQVYLNGVLLVRGTDYTASNGTSIDSLAALAASDVLEIITFTAFDLATAIDKSLFDAKGDILVATAADTPGKLTAGVDGYVLKANSATATGLEWAAVTDQTPLTTKGDLFTFSTVDARIEVGANDTVLTADSSAATGLKWAAVSGGYANYEVFNSSTTWTVPAGITKCAVYGVNGGAGGASGAALSGASNVGGAGGGFGVLFADPFFTVTPAASITVTIGGGGAGGVSASLSGSIAGGSANPSSFGALTSAYAIVANTGRAFKNVMTEIGAVGNAGAAGVAGGSLGAGGAAGAIGYTGSGGAGGGATNTPTSVAGSAGNLGAGGGGGGAGNAANATTTGGAGGAAGANTGAGGGGGGGAAAAGSAANRFGGNGGNGGSGVIVILY